MKISKITKAKNKPNILELSVIATKQSKVISKIKKLRIKRSNKIK